jgi:hypothetical protein
MTEFLIFVLLMASTMMGTQASSSVASDGAPGVTFNKDVLPILQRNCQTCHRPNGIAPMSFMTYGSTRPWAKAIKAAVINRQMPPWFADPHYAKLRNAPRLTQRDIDTLMAWADSGSQEGDSADRPPEAHWVEGWRIRPDVIVSMPEPHVVHAKGQGEIRQFVVPNPFKQDTWVTSIEIRPGDPSVVHHVIVQIVEQGPQAPPAPALLALRGAAIARSVALSRDPPSYQLLWTPSPIVKAAARIPTYLRDIKNA